MARTVYQTHRINISMFKECFKQEACMGTANIGSASFDFVFTNDEKRALIAFSYVVTDREGYKHDMETVIHIKKVPSNLGNWLVPYFVCPVTENLCRYLYFDNIDFKLKSIHAQREKLYYPSQLTSGSDYACDRFHTLRRKIEDIENSRKRNQKRFKGRATKHEVRMTELKAKRDLYDEKMWKTYIASLASAAEDGIFYPILAKRLNL